MSDDRPPVYFEDGKWIFRASSIGTSCLWELVAAGQGYTPGPLPVALTRAFEEGNAYEPLVIRMMQADGWVFESTQHEGLLNLVAGCVRFHSDGIATHPSWGRRIVEVKALNDTNWKKAKRHGTRSVVSSYGPQGDCMMHGEDLPLMWVAFNKGGSFNEVTGQRERTPDTHRLHYEPCDAPRTPMVDIEDKVRQVVQLIEADDIVDSGRPCDNPSHYPCRYQGLVPVDTVGRTLEGGDVESRKAGRRTLVIEDNDKFNFAVRQFLYHKGQLDEAKERMEHYKRELIDLAGGLPSDLESDTWVVPVLEGTNTSGLDFDRMPDEFRDELNTYRKRTKYAYIRGIKRKAQDDG